MNHTNIKTTRFQNVKIKWSDDNLITIPLITFFIMLPLTVVLVVVTLIKSFLFLKSLFI